MKKILIVALAIQIFVVLFAGYLWKQYLDKKIDYSLYIFANPVPRFNAEQDALIRKLMPKVVEVFPEFFRFYIESVVEKEGNIILSLRVLDTLQDGGEKGKPKGKDTIDGVARLTFDRNLSFVKKEGLY